MTDTTLLMQLFIIANAAVFGAVLVLTIQLARSYMRRKYQTSQAIHETPKPPKKSEPEKLAFDSSTRQRIIAEAESSFQNVLDKSVASLEQDLNETTERIRKELERIGRDAEGGSDAQYETLANLQSQTQTIINNTQSTLASYQADITKRLVKRQVELETELSERVVELEEQLTARQAQLQAELNERQAELEANLAKHHAEVRTEFRERQEKVEADLTRQQTELESALAERKASMAKIQTELDAELQRRRQELETQLQQEMAAKREFFARQIDTKLSDAVSAFLLEAMQHNIDLGSQSAYLTGLLEEHKPELIREVQDETTR